MAVAIGGLCRYQLSRRRELACAVLGVDVGESVVGNLLCHTLELVHCNHPISVFGLSMLVMILTTVTARIGENGSITTTQSTSPAHYIESF